MKEDSQNYSAAPVLQSVPYLRMLFKKTHLSNQCKEIVRLLLDSNFLISELEVLPYFTHKVTLSFLHCVEISTRITSKYISTIVGRFTTV